MIRAGVHGIIMKPYQHSAFMKSYYELLKKNEFDVERRQHVRVIPDGEHIAKVTLRHPTTKRVITGSIVNLSIGGLAIKPFSEKDWLGISVNILLPLILI